MTEVVEPDPGMIGGVPTPPLAILPRPARLFDARAARLDVLAEGSNLGPYLRFLAGLARVQARLAAELPAPLPVPADRVALARASRMPPIDRHDAIADPARDATLTAL